MSHIPIPMRPLRKPWSDRWLLDVFRERGKDLTGYAGDAQTAWEALEETGVAPADILKVITDRSPAAQVDLAAVGAAQAKLLPEALAERYDVAPVSLDGRTLVVATGNPLRPGLDRDLAFASGVSIRLGLAHPAAVRAARQRAYAALAEAADATAPGIAPRRSMPVMLGARPSGASERLRILLVDEQLQHRRALRTAFERLGCITLEAADGESALAFASAVRPDAVVTEVVLPKLNGVGLAQALLTDEIVKHVFICTDQRDEPLLQWVSGCGVADVIPAAELADEIAARVVRQIPARSGALRAG